MNTIVIVTNPFNPSVGREIRQCGIVRASELYSEFPDTQYSVYAEGDIQDAEYVALDNTLVTVVPIVAGGGNKKMVLGIVAMVAVAAVSMGAGSFAAGNGFWAMSMKGATTWAYAAAMGTMLVGSLLVNRWTAQRIDTGGYDAENNPTYSWGEPQTMQGQNNPIPLTYGKVQSAGQTIGQYISNDGDKEVLNWLVACGEGPLQITNIRLNDNEISFYSDVTAEIRTGENVQQVISNFNDTYSTKALGYELTDDTERTDTITGNATEGIIIKLECSQGLFHAKSNGKLGEAWIKFNAWYKLHTDSTWTTWLSNAQIAGAQNTALRKEFRLDHLPAGQYDVKVKVTERSASVTSTEDSVRVWWTTVTGIVYDDFSYPNMALIGIRGLATSQLSGTPALKFIKERSTVWVWNGYNYEAKSASNPAWAAYDMLHQCQKLLNPNTYNYDYVVRGVPARAMMYDRFAEWAEFCEENELTVNIEICTSGEMLNIVNDKIACIGRGRVVRFGTKYGCIWDSVATPVQMFGMGNIVSGTFEENFLQVSDRANCVEVTYTDAERDYSRETIIVYSDTYDTDGAEKMASVTYDGITDYDQAFREAKYQLYSNKYLLRTVSFEADIDSIACMVGDVILVSHDVPEWGQSGRVYSVDDDEIVLPVEFEETEDDIVFQFRTVDDTIHEVEATLVESADGWTTISIDTDTMPERNDIFTIGTVSHMVKPFRVTSIDRSQDFRRRITAVEYDERIYSEEYDIPPIEYTPEGSVAEQVTDLQAKQITYTANDGTKRARLYVSWQIPETGGMFSVAYSDDGTEWRQIGVTSNESIYCDIEPYNILYVRVITQLGVTQSKPVIAYPIMPGEDSLPPDITELNVERIADGTRRYYWDFAYPDPNDIAGFRIKTIAGSQPNWNLGADVQEGLITSQPYEATTVRQGTHTVMIKAVDNAGQESGNYAACVMDFGDVLADNVLQVVDFSDWEETAVEIKGLYVGTDGFLHSTTSSVQWTSANDSAWSGATDYAWEAKFSEAYAEFEMQADAGGYWWLEYDISGAVRIMYWLNDDGVKKQYSTRVKVKAGDVIHISVEADPTNITIRGLTGIVDVPDRTEHFESISITTTGTELPIITPNYVTTAVRLDNVQGIASGNYELKIVSREPCVIKVNRIDNNASGTQTATAVTADITWQGYENEVITDDI